MVVVTVLTMASILILKFFLIIDDCQKSHQKTMIIIALLLLLHQYVCLPAVAYYDSAIWPSLSSKILNSFATLLLLLLCVTTKKTAIAYSCCYLYCVFDCYSVQSTSTCHIYSGFGDLVPSSLVLGT